MVVDHNQRLLWACTAIPHSLRPQTRPTSLSIRYVANEQSTCLPIWLKMYACIWCRVPIPPTPRHPTQDSLESLIMTLKKCDGGTQGGKSNVANLAKTRSLDRAWKRDGWLKTLGLMMNGGFTWDFFFFGDEAGGDLHQPSRFPPPTFLFLAGVEACLGELLSCGGSRSA